MADKKLIFKKPSMKKTINVIATFVVIALVISRFFRPTPAHEILTSQGEFQQAVTFLQEQLAETQHSYQEYRRRHGLETMAVIPAETTMFQSATLNHGETLEFNITVPESALYTLVIEYEIEGDALSGSVLSVFVNGELPFYESRTMYLPAFFQDVSKDFPVDRFSNQLPPPQTRVEGLRAVNLFDNSFTTLAPLHYFLESGEHEVRLENISSVTINITDVVFQAPSVQMSYEQYRQGLTQGQDIEMVEFLEIQAPFFTFKNSTEISMSRVNNPSFSLFDSQVGKLNALNLINAGNEVTFVIDILQSGFYHLAFHYQNDYERRPVFASIAINGEIPFKELSAYEFPATRNRLGNETLSDEDGNPFWIYFPIGTHEISLRMQAEPYQHITEALMVLNRHMNAFTIEMMKLTGTDVDRNRLWRLTRYIEGTESYLEAYIRVIDGLVYELLRLNGGQLDSNVTTLQDSATLFRILAEDPDNLPLRFDEMNTIAMNLANVISDLDTQSLTLSSLYVFANTDLPAANASGFERLTTSVSQLFQTFFSSRYAVLNDPETVNVWANLSPMHISIMQRMIDAEFTPATGQVVQVSQLPDTNRLIMASAANQTPDVALGIWSFLPFDLAVRGALFDLTYFDDFWEVASWMPPGLLPAYSFNQGMYGVPDALDFQVLFYRTDILEALNLESPSTWQDVIEMLPTLQRFGMNFYHPMAVGAGLKSYPLTTPFIFQHGGELFADDGLSVRINEPDAIAGARLMGELFTLYSLPTQVPSFFDSFRRGIIPIGVGDSNDYRLIRFGAPELTGLWEIAVVPGVARDNGEINRTSVTMSTGSVIFADTDKPYESWEFLTWWLSADVQARFAQNMRMSFGDTFMWLPSNTEALQRSTFFSASELDVIYEQVGWQKDIARTPGYYMLERALSNAWNMMVFDGMPTQVAIDTGTLSANRELVRKMTELEFIDRDGNVIRPYRVGNLDWVLEQLERYGGRNGNN